MDVVKKKGGRPRKDKPRDKQVTVCFDGLEYAAVKRRAATARLSLSDYCRQLVLTGKAQARLTPEQARLLGQVAGLSNNLNQLAKRAHADGIRSVALEASKLMSQLGQILDSTAA